MPNILFFGDNHGGFDHIIEAVEREKSDAIVLLGDVQCTAPTLHVAPVVGSI